MTGKRPLENISYAEIAAARAGSRSRKVDIACPLCAPLRKGAAAKRKIMRTWMFDDGRIGVSCIRCGAKGWIAPDGVSVRSEKPKVSAAFSDDEEERERQRKVERAERIWREACSIAGTAGEAYLLRRGIDLASVPDYGGLRWHPRCSWGGGETVGCIISRFTDILTGAPRGIHRRPIDGQKPRTLGPMKDCVVRLWPDDAVTTGLVLGEGVETCLGASQIEHRGTLLQPVWAAGSAGNLASFPVLAGVEALTLLVDNDMSGAGQDAAESCMRRWRAAGREITRLTPRALGQDFNDIIKGDAA